jgi:hypothetical protein
MFRSVVAEIRYEGFKIWESAVLNKPTKIINIPVGQGVPRMFRSVVAEISYEDFIIWETGLFC